MKIAVTIAALALFAGSASIATAMGSCSHACAEGYTYNADTGQCVKQTVSS